VSREVKAVTRSDDQTDAPQAWRDLSDAGLVEIRLEEFAERIKDVKRVVVVRLRELLDLNGDTKERESAAHSLGTLKRLELKLLASTPNPADSVKDESGASS